MGSLAARVLILSWLGWWASPVVGAPVSFDVRIFDPGGSRVTADDVASGRYDALFLPWSPAAVRVPHGVVWLRLRALGETAPGGIPVVVARTSRQTSTALFGVRDGKALPLPMAVALPAFRGAQDAVFAMPERLDWHAPVYVRVEGYRSDSGVVDFALSTLQDVLERGGEHARMIALTFGALVAMSLSALLIWFVLTDKLFVLYASLFLLQALYIAFLSGQGFDWPLLSLARPLTSFAWNVPASLSGAVACLFAREIADLKTHSPRLYGVFAWFAWVFVLITFANLARLAGFGALVAGIGNVIFFAAALFTLATAFHSWRRGNRAAGWFLLAWSLLEGFTITAAMRFLLVTTKEAPLLYYYGLPLSMVAAAVFIALSVADRQRTQRDALTDAERRAGTDPLTGVLNRRSLLERLDSACLRAQARALPVALLFIDLDHFKAINDSHGHAAGDACLRAIVGPIQLELRHSDAIGRYGGEEFVVILNGADAASASSIARRILECVAAIRVEGFGPPIGLTCSIGVACSDEAGHEAERLLAKADAAVYAAKRSGRNRVWTGGASSEEGVVRHGEARHDET